MKIMAIIALILSLLSCGPSDNLLHVCWLGSQVQYLGCTGETQPVIWPKKMVPLKYWVSPELKEYHASIDAAARIWNGETCEVLVETSEYSEADVEVIYTGYIAGLRDSSLASVSHLGDGKSIKYAVVRFSDTTDIHTFFHWTTHEFGHVLGLGHDGHSIMRPQLPEMLQTLERPLPADGDIELLKGLYCR